MTPVFPPPHQDPDDDVRGVSAACLLPVHLALVQHLPGQVSGILQCLWDTLDRLDDLTASTNSIMTLLASLMSHPVAKTDAL